MVFSKEITEVSEALEDIYTDRTDVTFEIALHECGIVRNPDNDDTMFCINVTDGHDPEYDYKYSHQDISLEDVKEALEEAPNGYFSFIGSDRDTEINGLDNKFLALHIFSLNQWAGVFNPY